MTSLQWNNDFDQWKLICINVPGDGHCLFHALCLGFFKPYIDKSYDRMDIIINLRQQLSETLGEYVDKRHKIRYYDLLHDGHIKSFAEHVEEYSLEKMKEALNSDASIGYGYLEFIANQLNKDIYILDGDKKTLYKTDELLVKKRHSVVLYYDHGHYQLIGLKDHDKVKTHFRPTHPFILFLSSLNPS
jgi:hypothetical protein